MDAGTDSSTDRGTDSDGRWMTYAELAAVRRIDRHSAVKLVIRHGWRRQKDNRDTLRIFVPAEWAVSRDKGTDSAADRGTDTGTDLAEYAAAYRTAIEAKDGELAAVRGRVEVTQVQLAAAEQAADQARREVGAAQIAQAEAEADAAELRQADAARAARSRWRRLRDAWRR